MRSARWTRRKRRYLRWAAVGATLSLPVALAAAATATAARADVGAAQRWVEGFVAASTLEERSRYLAADVSYAPGAGEAAGAAVVGRTEYLRTEDELGAGPTATGPLYLDDVGAALLTRLHGRQVLVLLDIGRDGVQRRFDLVAVGDAGSRSYASLAPGPGRWPDQLWVLEGSGPCSGPALRGMHLDTAGRATSQRTLRLAHDLARCGGASAGWWSGRRPPEPLHRRVTGTVVTSAGQIEIRNGDGLQAAVREEVGRFERAGLGAPVTPRVTFDPHPRNGTCERNQGWFDLSSGAILVCADADTLCSYGRCWAGERVAAVLRHELAHAWVQTHVDHRARAHFLATVGLESWNDPTEHHDRRGIEWAAEILAWAVAGRSVSTPVTLAHPDRALLLAGCDALTGEAPAC